MPRGIGRYGGSVVAVPRLLRMQEGETPQRSQPTPTLPPFD